MDHSGGNDLGPTGPGAITKGITTLVAGHASIAETSVVESTSHISLTHYTQNGSIVFGILQATGITGGVGFDINSFQPGSNALQTGDVSDISWAVFNI